MHVPFTLPATVEKSVLLSVCCFLPSRTLCNCVWLQKKKISLVPRSGHDKANHFQVKYEADSRNRHLAPAGFQKFPSNMTPIL